MKTLYLDCGMGAAGDMLTAALLELFPNPQAMVDKLNELGIPGVKFQRELTQKCGIQGTHIHVYVGDTEEDEHPHDHHSHNHHKHHHSGMAEIEHWISHIHASDAVKENIRAVYNRIAQAESLVHGTTIQEIHFHEVGTLDALADVTAVCLLLHRLAPDKIIVSPVHVGSGQVRCAHGILPVPAPATAYLLRGIPIYGGQIQGELCTPTGAALIKHFATEFGEMPVMTVSAIGYGMGKKDFPRANCVRALLGESEDPADVIVELRCNVDDMTGETMGFALEQLLGSGALDAFTVPIGMKKSRPGVLITVLCREDRKDTMIRLLLKHTTTLGVREFPSQRYTLNRTVETVDTPYGPIRKKVSSGYGVRREKYEYEDLSKIAREQGLSIVELLEKIRPDS